MSENDSCPGCGSRNVIPIVYGLPGPELLDEAERGEVKLGGCGVADGLPTCLCPSCGKEWGSLILDDPTPAPKRRWFCFPLRTLFVMVSLVGCWLAYRSWVQRFDGELWRDPTKIEQGVRLNMADGLIARETLAGLSRAHVVEMLGEPPTPEYFRNWDMVYRLGNERGLFGIDSEWLVIRLGADGRVVEYRIVRD